MITFALSVSICYTVYIFMHIVLVHLKNDYFCPECKSCYTVIAAVLIVREYISKQCMNQISLPGERKAIFFSGSACVSYSCVTVYNACQIRLVMT